MYDIVDHGRMVSDRLRMDAYARAIERVVKPGDVVLDLGAGTGIFAMLACRAGARRVFAVDTSPYLEVARELASVNGFGQRIECIPGDSRALTLDEPASVIVSDIRGVLPVYGTGLATMIDARKRHLADRGTIIPKRDTMFVALLESEEAYEEHVAPWRDGFEGLDLRPALRLAIHESHKVVPTADEVLSDRVPWFAIDYATLDTTEAAGAATLSAQRDGTVHGLALSFDALLADGAGFSNADSLIYGAVFMPLEEPVAMRAGDAMAVEVSARLVGEDDYLWLWNTSLVRDGRSTSLFRQSSFFAYPRRIA